MSTDSTAPSEGLPNQGMPGPPGPSGPPEPGVVAAPVSDVAPVDNSAPVANPAPVVSPAPPAAAPVAAPPAPTPSATPPVTAPVSVAAPVPQGVPTTPPPAAAPPPEPAKPESFPHDPGGPPPLPPPPAATEDEGCNCEEGAPAWVMTFGDLMSLLLCFFILLFSMSSTDAAKFEVAAQSLREALGEASGEFTSAAFVPTDEPEAGIVPSSEAITDATMEVIASRLQQFVEDNGLEETVEVSREGSGVFLRMSDQALFSPGSANINQAAAAAVDQLGVIVEMIDIPVIVSGHTDNVPIRSNVFASNWELSAARAAGVARTLVGTGRDPAAVTVEAYGEYQPLAENDTPEGRAKNRRVEVYYSKETLAKVLEERGVIDKATDGAAEPTEVMGEGRVPAEAVPKG